MFNGIAFMAREDLTPQQVKDLRDGMNAASAFWEAAQADASWDEENLRPHNRCIYCALAVRDILHATGRKDAFAVRTGLDLRGHDDEGRPRSLTIGCPTAPRIEAKWNAHLVARLGDIIIDPSIAQTRRSWNDMPHYAAFLATDPQGETIDLRNGRNVPARMVHRWRDDDGRCFQLAHFRLTTGVDLRTRDWGKAPDALPEWREAIVRRAVEILRKRQEEEVLSKAASPAVDDVETPGARRMSPAIRGIHARRQQRRHPGVRPAHADVRRD